MPVPPLPARAHSRAALQSLNTQHGSQMRRRRRFLTHSLPPSFTASLPHFLPLPPSPVVSEKHLRAPPASYLLEPRWPFLPPFPSPCFFDGNTTPCFKRRLGTGDLQWTNSGRWNSAPTPFPHMQAVLAGLSMAPNEYFGELQQRRRRRAIWLTTGHDK